MLLLIFSSVIPYSFRYVLLHIVVTVRLLYAQQRKSPSNSSEEMLK